MTDASHRAETERVVYRSRFGAPLQRTAMRLSSLRVQQFLHRVLLGRRVPVYLAAVLGIAVVDAIGLLYRHSLNSTTMAMAMLLVVLFVAAFSGIWPALVASLLAAFSLDYFFLSPLYSFEIGDPQDWVAFISFFITALTVGSLFGRASLRAVAAEAARREATAESAYNRGLLEASLDPLVAIGRDGKITDLNSATAATTGRSRDKLIGTDFSECFTDPAQARAGYEQAFREGSVRDYPLVVRRSDGVDVPVRYNASVYRNEAGEIAGVLAAARDMSGMAQVEREIRHLASFPEHAPVAIIEFDRALQVQFINPAMRKVLTDSRIDNPRQFIPVDWKKKLVRGDVKDEPGTTEIDIGGHSFDERLFLSQELQSLRIWATDVTELRRAQRRDREAALYARSLTEASLDPLVAINADGKITDVNRAAEDAIGLARTALIGGDFADCFTEPEKARTVCRQVLATGSATDCPLALRHISGQIVDVFCNASVYRDQDGRVAGIFAVVRNITGWGPARTAVRPFAATAGTPVLLGLAGGHEQALPPRPENADAADREAQAMSGLDARLVRLYRTYAWLAGTFAAVLGLAALLGWIAGIPLLTSLDPAWVSMKVNTAVALIVAGVGLVLDTRDSVERRARTALVRVCAGFVMVIGSATLTEYVFGLGLGIDQLLIAEPAGTIQTTNPGRMAPTTAGSFALFGLALLAHTMRRRSPLSAPPALLVLTYSVLVITGYLFGAEELYSFAGRFTAMALPTALAFLLLSSGLLVTGLEERMLHWLASPRAGGVMLRHLLPIIVATPLLIEWLRLQTQAAGWFTTNEFGAATVGVANVVLLSCVLLWAAAELERSDAARLRSEAHRAAAQYARSLLEASLDPLVAINPDGKITDVNRATEEAVGRSRSGLIGTDFADYFTEPEKARMSYRKVLETGSVIDYPLAIRHVTGRIIDVLYNASLYRDRSGAVAGVFAAARDVTARKLAEDEVRASEQRYRTLVDAINDGLMLVDPNLVITYVNGNFAEMLGRAEADIIGHRSIEFMDDASRRLAPAALERRKAGLSERYELTFVRRDGRPLPTQLSARPILDQDRRYVASLSVVRDLTEIKQTEQELAGYRKHLEELVETRTADLTAAKNSLEAANQELESFSYSVSHDLRVPLRAIDGFSRILLEDYGDKLDDEGRRVANVVRDSAQKMGRLIDDILAFSRVGRLEMADEPVDMDALARSMVAELEPLAVGRKLTIEVKPLPAARGDAAMLQRVWTNLLDNAIKFTKPKAAAVIEVRARREGDEVVYSVKDNGVGFDMIYVGKLFGVFQRLHGVDEFPGTGIGLAIVKRIVVRHGGRVWAEGKLNEGATFYFALPAREVEDG